MAKNKQTNVTYHDWLRTGLRRATLAHFVLLTGFALQTIVMDAWHILVPEIILKRWLSAAVLLGVVSVVWYMAHNRTENVTNYKRLTFILIVSDILFTAYTVYFHRGLASKYVAMFAIPITVAAILLSRSAIYMTALLSMAAYIYSTNLYFENFFNESYKTELYSEIIFYALLFLVYAMLLANVIRFGGDTDSR